MVSVPVYVWLLWYTYSLRSSPESLSSSLRVLSSVLVSTHCPSWLKQALVTGSGKVQAAKGGYNRDTWYIIGSDKMNGKEMTVCSGSHSGEKIVSWPYQAVPIQDCRCLWLSRYAHRIYSTFASMINGWAHNLVSRLKINDWLLTWESTQCTRRIRILSSFFN